MLFILVDTGQALVMDWAEKRGWDKNRAGRQYIRQTVPVFEAFAAIVIGLVIAGTAGGFADVKRCFDTRLFLTFLPVAVFFATGLSLKIMAVNHFQAGTIKIIGQLRLPVVALVSTLLLARHYSIQQWQVIAILTTSCLSFVLLKGQGRSREGKTWKSTGWAQLSGWVLLNVVGGIIAEHTYKSGNLPFYVQKVSADFGHLLVSSIMLLLVVPRVSPEENLFKRPGGFFDSWDRRTFCVVLFLSLDAWIGNLMLKEFSGVTRSIAKAFGVSVVYFASMIYSKDRRSNPVLTLVALLVIQSSVLFAYVS